MRLRHRPRCGALRRAVFVFVLLAASVLTCGSPPSRWNVLLVTIDTTRADHIGCYGHTGARTPTIDGLAKRGVLFERALATVPITLPSHSSLMTGRVPPAHGVRDNGLFVLGDEQVTLAEHLQEAGYRTGAAIGAFPLTAQFGIDQGFEFFDDHLGAPYEDLYGQRVLPKERLFFDERPASRVNEAAFPWLDAGADHKGEPFFLWLHYFDPHHPHEPPAPYDQLFAHELYDGEIAFADEALGAVLDKLEQLGVEDETIVVVTSDHGEGRGEHDESTHSLLAYQSTLHVPLIMSWPGGPQGRRVTPWVSSVDVVPTVLDLLGLSPPAEVQGRTLKSLAESEGSEGRGDRRRELYAETLSPRLSRGWGELRALLVDGKKYIHGPRPELFDLDQDPRELVDLSARQPDLAGAMRERLQEYLDRNANRELDSAVAIDEETKRRLQALGYLQSSGNEVGAIDERLSDEGDPPQDHAATVTSFSHARNLLFDGRALQAQGFLHDLLRDDPGNPYYLEMLAQSELLLGDFDGALSLAHQIREMNGTYPPLEQLLTFESRVLLAKGDPALGYSKLAEAETLRPTATGSHQLGLMYQAASDLARARRFFEQAVDADPTYAPAHTDLGIQTVIEGQPQLAREHFLDALAAAPFYARAHYNLGALHVQEGQLEDAISRFERAVHLRPTYLRARVALVEVLSGMGQLAEAREQVKALAGIAPQSAEALRARELLSGAEDL